MAGPDLTLALGRLLSDRALRSAFAANPGQVARVFALSGRDADLFVAMDPAALEQQAQALLAKRRAEVARVIPQSWRLLGASAPARFDDHASACWPSGHLRHPQDALAFLRFLARHGLPHDRMEALRLDTRLSSRRRRIHLVSRAGRWKLPALYVAWQSRRVWRERLVHLGP